MVIANLKRYDQDRDCDCGQTCVSGMREYPDGEFVKFDDIKELLQTGAQQPQATCLWSWDHDGYYDTQCGDAFVLLDGTPKDNGMKVCPYCGGQLVVR